MWETRETTLLEMAALIIKHEILERNKEEDFSDLVNELVEARVSEIETKNKKYKYIKNREAFTCEITTTQLFVIKHNSIDEAIRYAVENIGEIHIIFNDCIVVIGGPANGKINYHLAKSKETIEINILEKQDKGLITIG